MPRRALPVYGHLKPGKRPKCETPLKAWCLATGTSVYAVCRAIGCDTKTGYQLANGQLLPNLIQAFKIDEYTKGGCPPSAWLGTDLAKIRWNSEGADWENLDKLRKAANERLRHGKDPSKGQ